MTLFQAHASGFGRLRLRIKTFKTNIHPQMAVVSSLETTHPHSSHIGKNPAPRPVKVRMILYWKRHLMHGHHIHSTRSLGTTLASLISLNIYEKWKRRYISTSHSQYHVTSIPITPVRHPLYPNPRLEKSKHNQGWFFPLEV
jgi:hypothetical protein